MKKTKFNEGWKYWPGTDAFPLVWGIEGDPRNLPIPKEIMQENRPYHERKIGAYFKQCDVSN